MKNDNVEFDFTGHVKNIEDVDNIDIVTTNALTDNQLEEAGLVKTSAFIRTKKSKNALRVKKHKDKKASTGIKQLNVEVPEGHRNELKLLAKDLCSGKQFKQALIEQCADTYLRKLIVKVFF